MPDTDRPANPSTPEILLNSASHPGSGAPAYNAGVIRQAGRNLQRLELALAASLPILFLLIAVARAWPFVDDVPFDGPQGDDWFFYKKLAASIVSGGLSIPAIGSYVLVPHGFLYPYFLAGVFSIFGDNASIAYVVQATVVGISGVVLWSLVRRRMEPPTGIVFLVAIGAVLYLDFVRRISFKLLSENLFLFLFAIFLFVFARAYARRSNAGAALAGVLLGLTVLSRTSIAASALGIVLLACGYGPAKRETTFNWGLALAAGFAVAMCLLPLREYAAIGRPNVDLILNNGDWVPAPAGIAARAEYYGRRVLFTLGATGFVIDEFRFRPHWLAIWCGVLAYIVMRIRSREWPPIAEAAVLIFLPLYLAPVIMVAGIENYGGRMVAAAMPFAAMLAGRAISSRPGTP